MAQSINISSRQMGSLLYPSNTLETKTIKVDELTFYLSEQEIKILEQKIDDKRQKIEEHRAYIKSAISHDFKNTEKVSDYLSDIRVLENDIIELDKQISSGKQHHKISDIGRIHVGYNQSLMAGATLNWGGSGLYSTGSYGTYNYGGLGNIVTNGYVNGNFTMGVDVANKEQDNVDVIYLTEELNENNLSVIDDLFKSEFGNLYLLTTGGDILYLKYIIDVNEFLNNDEEKDSKLYKWFNTKNRNYTRKQKIDKLYE